MIDTDNIVDLSALFAYDAWPSRYGQNWGDAAHHAQYDDVDFHVDLGCGRLPKARIGVDRYAAPGVAVVVDCERGLTYGLPRAPGQDAVGEDGLIWCGESSGVDYAEHRRLGTELRNHPWVRGLPFDDNSIESIISSHFFEHIGEGFIPLVEECYRVLKPGGLLRAITPLFPSWSAQSDPDHRRMFMAATNIDAAAGAVTTWDAFCGQPGDEGSWLNSFSVPYTTARFECVDVDFTGPVAPELQWTWMDARELRVALIANK